MMLKRKLKFITILCTAIIIGNVTAFAQAQKENKSSFVIKGKVTELKSGEPIVGADVFIETLQKGAVTDENGDYIITGINKGKYKTKIVCITYKEVILDNVEIGLQGEKILNVQMEEDINLLGEVVVQGIKKENTELSAINTVRNSLVVMSAVSSGEISKTPDKNAAEVVKRVPGVSIVDDRFIVIRGLPQRYNNVWLNNCSVPGSEPDTRSFSFDMVPTSQIENILIIKSPSAELPAEFTGGFLKIQSKSVPDRDQYNVQYSIGANTKTGFNNFIKINNENWNIKSSTPIPDQKGGAQINKVAKFSNGNMLGITAGAEYSYQQRIIANMKNSRYGVYNRVNDTPEFIYDYTDNIFSANSKIGALLNGSYLFGNNKITLRNLFNRSNLSRYTTREGWQNISSRYNQEKYEYLISTRTIYTGQIAGEHIIRQSDSMLNSNTLDWNVSYSFASKNDPDRRIINREQNTFVGDKYFGLMGIDQNEITRDNTKLNENIITVGANYLFTVKKLEIKSGLYGEFRNRKYTAKEMAYRYNQANLPSDFKYLDPVSQILINSNMGSDKLYLYDDTDNRNSYKGKDLLGAAYIQALLPIGDFKINAGVRFEARNMTLTSFTSILGNDTKDDTYTQYNVFPSLNVAYNLNKKQIIRFAYGMSTNRQEFREVSSSVYYDFNLFSDVKGNPALKAAIVQNIDLKYELYVTPKEYVTLALFYKHFKNPIEWTYLDAGGSYTYTFENAQAANNYGVELDIRKNLGFIGMRNFTFGFNASLIKSKVVFDKKTSLEKDRPMQGQSPYLVNTSLFYEAPAIGIQIGVLYNRIGKRIVGIGRVDTSGDASINNDVPDTYELPRDMLDLVVSKKLGKYFTIKANVKDVLNQSVVFAEFPRFYGTDNSIQERKQISKEFKLGSTYSLSLQFTF
ncbi:MAG: outer membrane beta-barrel protein [Bacteroidales bacterium]